MDSCVAACTQIATALGPLGELIVLAVAGLIAWVSRRQLKREREARQVAQTKVETLETAIRSIAPPSVADAMKAPRLPLVEIRPSIPTTDEEP